MLECSLLLPKQLVLLCRRGWGPQWWAGARPGEEHRTCELSWHQHALVPFCRWEKHGPNGHPRSRVQERSLFTSHPPKAGCFYKSNPCHSIQAERKWTGSVQSCSALSHVFTERGKKKEKQPISMPKERVEWSPGSKQCPCGQEILPEPSSCLGSGAAQQQQLTLAYQFPHDSKKMALISHKDFFLQLLATLSSRHRWAFSKLR